MKQGHLVLGGSVVAALVTGAAAGYFFAKKQLETRYEALMAQEVETTKEFYRRLYKKDGFETAEEAARTLGISDDSDEVVDETAVVVAAAALKSYQGVPPSEQVAKVVNIFRRTEQGDEEVDEPETMDDQDVPFIISQKVFMQNDPEHTQCTVTWFELDKVLIDEREDRLDDYDNMVGANNLERFGHKSNDPNVVYVRNDSLQMDFEILLSRGKYTKDVLGLDD